MANRLRRWSERGSDAGDYGREFRVDARRLAAFL
ncbi:hypothetical protein NKDENANG_01213 [Candidatus Entotheonellaceae bacterium PAL068K]